MLSCSDWGIIMANYFLFLDELKSNDKYEHFCIGGCFIEEQCYRNTIIKQVNKLKNEIFGNTSIILHETDIRSRRGAFKKLREDEEKEKRFWSMLGDIYQNYEIHTLCAGVHKENLKNITQIKMSGIVIITLHYKLFLKILYIF